jgi:outer membrane protein assembly factor BamB
MELRQALSSVRRPRLRLTAIAAVAALGVTSGCWLQIGASGGHSRDNPVERTLTSETVGGLHEQWSADVTGGASEPIVRQGRVFVTWTTANSTGVQAFRLADGTTAWNRSLLGGVGGSGSIVLGAPVTFVGDQLWGAHLGFAPIAPGPGGPGPACVSGTDVLDPATGAGGGGGDFSSAVASAGGTRARTLFRLGSDCSATFALEVVGPGGQWTSAPFGISSGGFLPTLAGDQVFLSRGTVLEAFVASGCGAATCTPAWSRTFASGVSNAMAGTTGPVYVTADGALVALDRTTGAELWRMAIGPAGEVFSGGLALAEGTVYVVAGPIDGTPTLRAIDAAGCGAASCSPDWTATLPGTGLQAPTVGADVVYTSTSTGVHAFAAAGCGASSCAPLTSVALTASGTLSVAEGHVLVASGNRLTALGLG